MANTSKSVAELVVALRDNGSHLINAQTLRDMLVSCLGVYGGLSCFEASTEQVDPNTGAKLTCFTTNTASNGCTPDHTNDQITIGVSGVYNITFQASFSGTASSNIKFRLRKNGTEQNFGCTRKLGSTGDIGSASFVVPSISLVAGDVLTIYVEADGATDDLTVADAQFGVRMIG